MVVVELLGEEFAALVDELQGRVRALQAGESVERLVLLEAESGSGKSRVVRELYARMRSTQTVNEDGDGYWPALDEHAGRGGRGREALPTRKVIGPPTEGFVRPPGTLPDFFWLQVQCAQAPSEALIPAIELVWPSLRAHAKFVAEAWRQKAGLGERGKRAAQDNFIEEAKGLGTEASVEALSRLLGVFDVAAPGLGWIATKTVQAGTAVYKRQKFKVEVEAGGALGSGLQPPEELTLQLLRMAHRELPLIVVVEDAHLMDDGLAEALGLLAEPDLKAPPVLVIATAWPEGRTREGYQRWRRAMLAPDEGRPRAVLVADGTARPFPSLTLNDRVRMVREHASATDQATAELIATKWTNPYALRLAASGDRLRQFREGDAFVVTLEDLDEMPEDIEDLYRDRWVELPDPVRQALMLAAGALPDPGDDGSVWPYLTDVVARAAAQIGLLDDPDTVSAALDEAVDPFEWARLEDQDLDLAIFREWVLQRVARERYRKKFVDRNARAFTAAVGDEIARRIDNARGDGYLIPSSEPTGLPLSRWLLALQPDRDDEAAATGALTVALALEGTRPVEVIRLLKEPDRLTSMPRDDSTTFWARGILARSLSEVGRNAESIDQYVALLNDQVRVLGPEHLDTLVTRNNLAVVWADSGRVEDALNEFQRLLLDRERVLGENHPDTIFTRGNLAGALRDAGRTQDALQEYETTLQEQIQVLGPDHPSTLFVRHNFAATLSNAGRIEEALAEYSAVLSARLLVLGPDHPDTLATRLNIAGTLRDAGRVQEALDMYPALLADTVEVLGPDDPVTLAARHNRAVALHDAGQTDEALNEYNLLLADCVRVLGQDHPDTLLARMNIAATLSDAGRTKDAILAYEELVVDQLRDLGRDHPLTFAARDGLAETLVDAGRREDAILEYRDLISDMTRVLGPDDPDTIEAAKALDALFGD